MAASGTSAATKANGINSFNISRFSLKAADQQPTGQFASLIFQAFRMRERDADTVNDGHK
jgi:hypothetical protein